MIRNKEIDNGHAFDWGRTSSDYAKYRDIYPQEFYKQLLDMGVGAKGQKILDIGTGTGVLPRNMYQYGAEYTGIDASENQIKQAINLAQKEGMDIKFQCTPAEKINFPKDSFDAVTACQCFTYFNHKELAVKLHKVLKENGRFIVLYMAWLPDEDKIAGMSEELILKYNPFWTGCKEERHVISIPEAYSEYFIMESQNMFDIYVPFTRESWNGRIKSCRGIGAALSPEEVAEFENEHRKLLNETAKQEFEVLHYAAITTIRKV